MLARVTSASDSSGETATLIGGPTTLVGTFSSATTFGGFAPRSMIVTVSGGGFATTLLVPLSSVALLSFAETTICASAPVQAQASAVAATAARMRGVMEVSSVVVRCACAVKRGAGDSRRCAGAASGAIIEARRFTFSLRVNEP